MVIRMKINKLVAIILISSILYSCATITPRAIEDTDEGPVLIIESDKLLKVVENWGFENNFQYVAYRRLATETTTQWAAASTQYGAYGSSYAVHFSRVLVMGIDDPENIPANFNLTIVPHEPHKELTYGGIIAISAGGTIIGITLVTLLLFAIIDY